MLRKYGICTILATVGLGRILLISLKSYHLNYLRPGCSSLREGANHFHQSLPHLTCSTYVDRYNIYHGPPKPTCLEAFMVNNLVFRWPRPLFLMVLGV